MTDPYKIVILPGDGAGPEMMDATLEVLKALSSMTDIHFQFEAANFGREAMTKKGSPVPEETIEACKRSDAVLRGYEGYTRSSSTGNQQLRSALSLFAQLRPVYKELADMSTLKRNVVEGVDIMVVREISGGALSINESSAPTGESKNEAFSTIKYTAMQVYRIIEIAASVASRRSGRICNVDKAVCLTNEVAVALAGPARLSPSGWLSIDGFGVYGPADVFNISAYPESNIPAYSNVAFYDRNGLSRPFTSPIAILRSASMMLRYSLDQPAAADLLQQALQRTMEEFMNSPDGATNGSRFNETGVDSLACSRKEETEPFLLFYRYLVAEEGNRTLYWEQGPPRQLELFSHSSLEYASPPIIVYDEFRRVNDQEKDIFDTLAFRNVLFRRDTSMRKDEYQMQYLRAYQETKEKHLKKSSYVLQIQVPVYQIGERDQVFLTGTTEEISANANGAKAVGLYDTFAPLWSSFLSFSADTSQFAYTLGIGRNTKRQGNIEWKEEEKEMRIFRLYMMDEKIIRQSHEPPLVVCHVSSNFRHASSWKGAGIAIPVFSLRTKESCGVGEFLDLKLLVDFCARANYQLLQLLPVNDTRVHNTWQDSYPYSSVSVCALHPLYLRLDSICDDVPDTLKKQLKEERMRLNALKFVDYEQVIQLKEHYIEEAYKRCGKKVLKSEAFLQFFEENKSWLLPYAVYRYMMTTTGTYQHAHWGKRSQVHWKELEDLASEDSLHFDHIGVVYFTQFHLHRQLLEASQYAAKNRIVLKGDLPIGVNRYCLDTWLYPHLFRLHMQCGAPPDYFAEFGQNWGFPTYNWEVMAVDNFAWWRSRLAHMSRYFHAYRIDHILGFFRIWEIPKRYVNGICGRFFPVVPITRDELESRGLWDIDRYCMPWIRESFLWDVFGADCPKVMDIFFDHLGGDVLKFKSGFDTEYKLTKAFDTLSDKFLQENKQWLIPLVRLQSNVILLRDEEEPERLFHPRIDMMKTSSYHELPNDAWKHHLYELYNDYFFYRQDMLWRQKSMQKLPMMKNSTGMLVIGEDLGMIPACVPDIMNALSLIGMRIQRMPSDPHVEFAKPSEYEYLTVATPGSHDMATIRGWWEEMEESERQRFYEQILQRSGNCPRKCETDIVKQIIEQHVASPSIWSIFLLQDILGMDAKLRRDNPAEEQINVPANPKHYWRYRLHITLEDLLQASDFIDTCREMNQRVGRGMAME
eukprot:jgi/Galph1/3879/GphlegSOOS_G2529.1